MLLSIRHTTTYNYSEPVFFDPHQLRFKPKNTAWCKLQSYSLKVLPRSVGHSDYPDLENNQVQLFWFEQEHSTLKIIAESVLEIESYNPFNFFIPNENILRVPFKFVYSNVFSPFLECTESMPYEFINYVDQVLQEDSATVPFLMNLTAKINQDFKLETRVFGEPLPMNQTFEQKKGACRDLAWMQIQMLRSKGIASRFVSGYLFLNEEGAQYELHAWVEVFLPKVGWLGLDPSHGIFVNQNYIIVSQSVDYKYTMPVIGKIRGNASSQLNTELQMTELTQFNSNQ